MKNKKVLNVVLFLLIALMGINTMHAQSDGVASVKDNSEYWTIGFGLNVIYDAGLSNIGNIFSPSYNHYSIPIIVTGEYAPAGNYSFIGSASINKYKSGKIVDNYELQDIDSPNYLAFDVGARYYIGDKLNFNKLDPFLQLGLGYNIITSYTNRPTNGSLTFNPAVGANIWFSEKYGLNLMVMPKFGLNSSRNNRIQSSFGIIYRGG